MGPFVCMYLREGLALTLHPVFGWEGHTGPGRRTVKHDAAVVFTNFTTESEKNIFFNNDFFTLVDYLASSKIICSTSIMQS